MGLAIEDYAVIGDCRSAALISRAGSVDWLCWPRFDSPSLLAALLDPDGGQLSVGSPLARAVISRRYLDATPILQTRFSTPAGDWAMTDFMPVASEDDKRRQLTPDHDLLRLIECERGQVEVQLRFSPRPDYGRPPRLRERGPLGLFLEHAGGVVVLRTDLPLRVVESGAVASERLAAGERRVVSLSYAHDGPAVLHPLAASAASLTRSIAWWRAWSARLRYEGPAREAVLRSALTIKLLGFAPSGAVVAAPTTSLPERIGGDLNWDYRFCWLRDASLTVRALLGLGYAEEAGAFVDWLLHSTRITRPELKVLYDVYGRLPGRERTLERFAGYANSRPVRVGNQAKGQLQLDVYGEVIDAAALLARGGARFDRATQNMLCDFGRYVCRNWDRPDEGIWEPRLGRSHHTHSLLLCWTAVDRLLELGARGVIRQIPTDELSTTRTSIAQRLKTRSYNSALDSYVATLDGNDVDATLLLLAWYGFEQAATPRMRATYHRLRRELGAGEALLYRYHHKQSPGEGAFGICSFWAAEYLARGGGTREEAEQLFAKLLSYGNDVGLFAEEIEPSSGAALGNFPQAFTHVGLINAALSLTKRQVDEP